MTKKIAIVIGTTAEYIKMMPVFKEFEKRKIDIEFIHTGQHDLSELIKTFKTQQPSIIVNPKDGFKGDTGSAFGWAKTTTPMLKKILKENEKIEYVICHGDTMSTLIATIAGRLAGKKIVHVEAGLRSGNLFEPFPEEIVRRIVDSLSDVKFAVSNKTALRLKNEVYNVGNTSIDALNIALKTTKKPKGFPKKYAVCTVHRHENIKSKKRMISILDLITRIPMPVYFAIHKNTLSKIEEYGLKDELINSNVKIIDHKTYNEFVGILKYSSLILTDGGSMQEEAATLNIPCVILRMATEREELLERGDQVLSKFGKIGGFNFIKKKKLYNPYYNGGASKQIVDIMVKK